MTSGSDAPTTRLVRAGIVRLVDHGDALLIVGRDGVTRRLDGASAALARAVIDAATTPRSRAELTAALVVEAGDPGAAPVIEDAIELLRAAGVLVRAPDEPAPAPARRGNLVLGVTGAIAAVHTPAVVLALQRRGWAVEVAMSRAARRFVAPAALTAICHRAIHTSSWPASPSAAVPHVALAAWADVVAVCPASATTIGRIAGGDFSDLVAAIALTTRAPVVLFPSMNPAMRGAAAVARNLARCASDGFRIAHGAAGLEVADAPEARVPVGGAAPPPEDVAAIIDAVVQAAPPARRTWDAIYAATPEAQLPWASPEIDDDLAAALGAHAPPPRLLLDVGTGLGVVARHAAARGYQVVATDVSEVALELARVRSDGAAVAWVRDDVTASALVSRFGAIVDRGCLHVLPRGRHAAWAAAMGRLAAPGGILAVKVHRDGALGLSAAALTTLLGDAFAPVAVTESTLPGPDAAIPARLGIFVRS